MISCIQDNVRSLTKDDPVIPNLPLNIKYKLF